jgi:3-phenylpropionate/trans-cinnamate dioxygenase ferredoxin reductase subunit
VSKRTFVIVGASLAGAKAAEELRERGFDGHVVLVGSEPARPYERPPLTKDYLRGESEREKTYVHEDGFYAQHEIELLTDTTATAIDPGASRITLDDGRELGYDRLLLATGAEPRRIPVPGAELDGVHYLRTLADCDVLRERLERGGRVVVVGAGWIGSEFAASARQRGLEVTLIDPLALPNERIFGAEIGAFYRDVHAQHGIELALGEGVDSFEGDGAVARVRTSSGHVIDCDFAVVGIGVMPRVELAGDAGLEVENGIVVDEKLQTSAPNVFAAGDVASASHPFYAQRIRVEHWANALNQGPAAARAMLGEPVSYDRIPYFFSDQYDVGMEYSGHAPEWDEVVFRGDRDSGEFIAFWLRDGRVAAGMNVNVWDVNEHIQALIRSRREIDVAAVTDPDTPLASLAGEPATGSEEQRA